MTLACPRCSYDQSGVVASWVDVCPLVTRCPECGFEIDIPQLRRDSVDPMQWWVERAKRLVAVTLATLTAPFLACAPWWLFKRLRVSHEPRFRRLLYPIALYVCLWYVLVSAWVVGDIYIQSGFSLTLDEWKSICVGSFMPLSLGLLGDPSFEAWTAHGLWWDTVQAQIPLHFVVAGLTIACMGSTLAFAALPIARRRAKVRWAHIVRAALIQAWTTPVMAIIVLMVVQFAFARDWLSDDLARLFVGATLACGLQAFMWYATAKWHFRMQRPIAVALSVSCIGLLGVLTALFVVVTLSLPIR